MSKKKNKKVGEGDENNNNDVEENNKEQNEGDNQKGEDGGKNEGGGGGGNGKNAVVLKTDLHCEGCASKVIKRIRAFEGVVNVEVDGGSNKLTVFGKVDPVKLRDSLEEKMHKKVELISPVVKKDSKSKDNGGGGDDGKDEKKKDSNGKENNKNKNKSDEKKSKEPPVTTAVLKVPLHCEGCIQKIHKIINKTKGYQEMKVDRQKDLVTVTGAIDIKALVESLKKHLKKNVEIVPPKKDEKKDNEKEKDKGKGGCGCGGGSQGKGGGGGGNGNGKGDGGDGEERMERGNKMQVQHGYGHAVMPYAYGAPYGHVPPPGGPHGPMPVPGYMTDPYQQFNYHAPQIFSDENPNACSVM